MTPVPTLKDYLRSGKTARVGATACARETCNLQGSTIGRWRIDCENVAQIYATDDTEFPNGLISMQPQGMFSVELEDLAGWHPFIAFSGTNAGRSLQVTIWYAWVDGETIARSDMATWDEVLQRYVVVGPASDGSLSANGIDTRISVSALDNQAWEIRDAWIGRQQLG